mmetsp:Transcript_13059/g.33540  ORF Transcript_13059/g.33540 Transcript_13059/m.33540 type:complete len:305 (+) Transcript_13059:600-1514(+)
MACPPSWYAVSFSPSSVTTALLRSAPIMIRSLANSKSASPTSVLLSVLALMAAILTTLDRSAPEKPGVPLATISTSTPGASGTFLRWSLRIWVRPLTSGLGTTTWRSNLPGRVRALSSTSGKFVAAMTTMPSAELKPSISDRSWLSVMRMYCWSLGFLLAPIASISSIKMMQGLRFLADSNRSLTLLAPTPTYISSNSLPDAKKKGTPASPAMALASSVLPVPGGPMRSTPLVILPPSRVNLCGFLRKSTTSSSSAFASSTPTTSLKVLLLEVDAVVTSLLTELVPPRIMPRSSSTVEMPRRIR